MNHEEGFRVEKYFTPYKYGKPVLAGSGVPGSFDAMAVDCPFVFYHRNQFHMLYVGFDGAGYQTGLAVSDDLLRWEKKGPVLKREESAAWDRVGAAGMWILKESDDLSALPVLKKVDGKYWMAYHSYPEEGYEEGSARIGLAYSEDEELLRWNRLPQPVFSWKDGADWEKGGLYKPCIIARDGRYFMFYNAKNLEKGPWLEQIGIAQSEDLLHWKRYEHNPVIKVSEGRWDGRFCADPFVVRDGERWLMFYYGFDGKHARDGLAVSGDLFTWHKYPEPVLSNGAEGELDRFFAHKPSMVCHKGVLYHFYCAVRRYREGDPAQNLWNEFRCISVAASRYLQGSSTL